MLGKLGLRMIKKKLKEFWDGIIGNRIIRLEIIRRNIRKIKENKKKLIIIM